MKYIREIQAERTFAGPGVWAYDAEARVSEHDGTGEVYVHVSLYDGFRNYTVSAYSTMGDDMQEPDYLESYDRLADLKGSAYEKVFKLLGSIVSTMSKEV